MTRVGKWRGQHGRERVNLGGDLGVSLSDGCNKGCGSGGEAFREDVELGGM